MRRVLIPFGFLLLILIFYSCTTKAKIDISVSSPVDTFSEITVADLALMIEEKQDFVLLVSSVSCSSCNDFMPIINQIISEKQIRVYKIEKGPDFTPENETLAYEFTPTFVVFAAGVITSKIDDFNNSDVFLSVASFTEYLRQYIVLDD